MISELASETEAAADEGTPGSLSSKKGKRRAHGADEDIHFPCFAPFDSDLVIAVREAHEGAGRGKDAHLAYAGEGPGAGQLLASSKVPLAKVSAPDAAATRLRAWCRTYKVGGKQDGNPSGEVLVRLDFQVDDKLDGEQDGEQGGSSSATADAAAAKNAFGKGRYVISHAAEADVEDKRSPVARDE